MYIQFADGRQASSLTDRRRQMLIGEKWMRWTLLEAFTRVLHRIPQKLAADVAASLAHSFLTTFIVGAVQTVLGFGAAKGFKKPIMAPKDQIVGSCAFGVGAIIALTLGNFAFQLGGDIGIYTFIVTLSIVPGAIIDHFGWFRPRDWQRKKLGAREWAGVGLALVAGHAVLGWPSLSAFVAMPTWVWVSLAVPLVLAINQAITQRIKDVDPFVKNFWGGATTMVGCLLGLLATGSLALLGDFSGAMPIFWLWSAILGLNIMAIWMTNLMSYKGGASIALKKLVMNGTFMTATMVVGILMFGEPLTAGKVVGVLLYFVAFTFMDKNTWEFMTARFGRGAQAPARS